MLFIDNDAFKLYNKIGINFKESFMKKFILLTSIVLIFTFLFAGCGGPDVKNPANENIENSVNGGILSNFTSTDVDGNTVDQSIFKGKKLTMVNVWTTYCGYCIQEMPWLAELNEEYSENGFQVVGIVTDVVDYYGNIDSAQIELAKEIIDETGADYLHILPSASLNEAKLSEVVSVPETIFIDENGNQVGESYPGARSKEMWKEIIDGLMENL